MNPQAERNSIHTADRPSVLVAGLFHETHTFLSDVTEWSDFTVHRGHEILKLKGDASPMGGMLQFADDHDWDILPTIAASASPSGIVHDDVYDRFIHEFETLVKPYLAERIDGVFLVLHGALVCQSRQDVEGDFIRHLRSFLRATDVPVYGVFDLHAHLSDAMMEYSHGLIAYRENPHADARESSIRAANLLDRAMATGIRPVQYAARPGIVWPPTGTGSADQPMRSLLLLARELETQHPSFQAINVVPGFAFGDTRDTGLGFSVASVGPETEALEALDQLSKLAIQRAADGCPKDADVDEVLTEFALSNRSGSKGPWVIAEPSDNVGGGAPGDATGLLRALLRHKISNAAVCLFDPEAVAELQTHSMGEMVLLSIGGKSTTLDPGPLEVSAKLLRMCDGRFELEDKQSHLSSLAGDRFDMGPCAIIDVSGVIILLTSHRTMPMDLGQWRSVGLPPEQFAIIGVKAAVAHRRVYEPIASKMISVDTPGPCQSNLRTLSFKHLRRPAFPLDPVDALVSSTLSFRNPKG